MILIAKPTVVVSNVAGPRESADEPGGFECTILSYHRMKLRFHMSYVSVGMHSMGAP